MNDTTSSTTDLSLASRLRGTGRWALIAIAVLWALELYLVQYLSFSFGYPVPLHKQAAALVIRAALTGLFSFGLVLLLPRLMLTVAFVVFLLFTQAALYYHAVFDRVITWTTAREQYLEGIEGAGFDPGYVNWPLGLVMLIALAVKLYWLWGVRDRRTRGRWLGAGCLAGYLGLVTLMGVWGDPMRKIMTFVSADRMGMTYGYLPTWFAESVYLDYVALTEEAVAVRAQSTDRLSAIESPIRLTGDVVIIQVESLDWRALGYQVAGKPLVPTVDRLAEEGQLFKVTAYHTNGSGDADFVMLNAVPPSPRVMTYSLPKYPYTDSLPEVAAAAGYETYIYHGNRGSFFARRRAFEQLPFTGIYFSEEMEQDWSVQESLWGVRDDVVFDASAARLQTADTPQLHFIITLTSHQPFIYLEPEDSTFAPANETIQDRYYNSIHFVDRALDAYLQRLKPGTLVVLYGDHRAALEFGKTPRRQPGEPEYVPFIIHRVGARLSDEQISRDHPLSLSGELTMVDAARFVHGLFLVRSDAEHIGN